MTMQWCRVQKGVRRIVCVEMMEGLGGIKNLLLIVLAG